MDESSGPIPPITSGIIACPVPTLPLESANGQLETRCWATWSCGSEPL